MSHFSDRLRAPDAQFIYRHFCLGLLLMSLLLPSTAGAITATLTVPATDNDGTFVVSWTVDPGPTQGGYANLKQRINSGSWVIVSSQGFGSHSHTVTASTSGNYQFYVDYLYMPANPCGGQWCNPQPLTGSTAVKTTVVTLAPPSGVPSISLASVDYDGGYSFSWNSITNATSYKWRKRVNGGGWGGDTTTSGTNVTTSNSAGTYGYQVKACNSNGCGNYSIEKTIAIVTTPPTGIPSITIPAIDYDGAYSFGWNSTSYTTYYKWQQRENGGSWPASEITTTGNSVEIPSNGSGTYGYRIRACNPNGCNSNYSNEATIIVVGDTTSYQYDELGRLIEVTHPNSIKNEYTYDAADNRISKQSSPAD